jgi:hypothetical protein
MALLPGSIFVDRSFIPDPAMVALVVTSFWMLIAYLQTERWHYLLLTSVIGAWGILTKIPGLILGLPMVYATWAILRTKRQLDLRRLLPLGTVAILTLVPVTAYYMWARYLAHTYPPYHFAGNANWIWTTGLGKFLQEGYFLDGLVWILQHWLWTAPVMVLVFLGLCLRPPHWDPLPRADQRAQDSFERAPWVFHWWMLTFLIYYSVGARELVKNAWNLHIFNPAAAALTGHAIVVIASLGRRATRKPGWLAVTTISFLIIGGFGQKSLHSNMYSPSWGIAQDYELGLALRQASAPGDLVVTVPVEHMEPTAIYYSQRRGWTFPPKWPGMRIPVEDDDQAIQLFEELRTRGADWLGIVASQEKRLLGDTPRFMEHIERTCVLARRDASFVIYRIPAVKDELAPP